MNAFTIDPSQDMYQWIRMTDDGEVPGIRERCTAEAIEAALSAFPDITVNEIMLNETGSYIQKEYGQLPEIYQQFATVPEENLPPYYEIRLGQAMANGQTNHIVVYLPLNWNGRFLGTTGGGSFAALFYKFYTYGHSVSWVVGVRNHFACVVTDAGVTGYGYDYSWGFNRETGTPDWEAIRTWSYRCHHAAANVGKALCEAVYGERPAFSYITGSSGGGRTCMEELRRYPEDYDGVLAFCPGWPWAELVTSYAWPFLVMNTEHAVPKAKYDAFHDAVIAQNGDVGGYTKVLFPQFDPFTCVGMETAAGVITEEDAATMKRIYDGPVTHEGKQLAFGYGPLPYQVGVHIIYDEEGNFVPHNAGLGMVNQVLGWGTANPDFDIEKCSMEEFERVATTAIEELHDLDFQYDVDIRPFRDAGGKAILAQCSADDSVPAASTHRYYERLVRFIGDEGRLNEFFRFFFCAGGAHVNKYSTGNTPVLSYAFADLMAWVEQGKAPECLQTSTYDFANNTFEYKVKEPVFSLGHCE